LAKVSAPSLRKSGIHRFWARVWKKKNRAVLLQSSRNSLGCRTSRSPGSQVGKAVPQVWIRATPGTMNPQDTEGKVPLSLITIRQPLALGYGQRSAECGTRNGYLPYPGDQLEESVKLVRKDWGRATMKFHEARPVPRQKLVVGGGKESSGGSNRTRRGREQQKNDQPGEG